MDLSGFSLLRRRMTGDWRRQQRPYSPHREDGIPAADGWRIRLRWQNQALRQAGAGSFAQ